MIKIIINTLRVLLRKKEFIFIAIIMPSLATVLLSYVMGQSFEYNVGIIDKDNSYLSNNLIERLDEIEGVNLVYIKENEEDKILLRQISLALKIDEGFNDSIINGKNEENLEVIYGSKSEILSVIKLIVEEEEKTYKNIAFKVKGNKESFKNILNESKSGIEDTIIKEGNEKRIWVGKSLGVIIMFIFLSSSLITRYIILENKKGTRGRILSSGISEWKYNLSILIVFYFASSLTSIFYYLLCRILDFDFGMENSIYYLVVLLFVNLISVAFNLLIGNLVSKPEGATNLNIIIIVPLAMLSGCFWEFSYMGENLRKIGSMIPLRWAIEGVEMLQRGEGIESLFTIFSLFILVSTILFIGSKFLAKEGFSR